MIARHTTLLLAGGGSNYMATVVQFENLQSHKDKKFRIKLSKPKDQLAQQLIKKLVKQPIWASESVEYDKDDKSLFKLYQLESDGLVVSKMEQKNKTRYERRFYITELGKKIANH